MQVLLFFLKMSTRNARYKITINLIADWIFEIGLTPNRMDAMSHLGVAKDICAYISHHEKIEVKVVSPFKKNLQQTIENSHKKSI